MASTKKKTIDNFTAMTIAVKANCDPRTIRKVLRGEAVRGGAGERARKALVKAGLLPPSASDLQEVRWDLAPAAATQAVDCSDLVELIPTDKDK